MEHYVIHDQLLIDALWESGIPCLREHDEHAWFVIDLVVEHGEKICLPNGMPVVRYGTELHLVGREFNESDHTPDKWYRDTWKIYDPFLPDLIREAGYMCDCIAVADDGSRWYEVNFYVSPRKACQLSRTLTVEWVQSGQIARMP
jgi:hypothetical protein